MSEDPNGPRNLRKAFGMLGGMKQTVRERQQGVRGPNGHKLQTCDICHTHYKATISVGNPIGRCRKCQQKLLEKPFGCYVVFCADEFAFIKCDEARKDLAGRLIPVKPENWTQIKKLYEIQQAKTDQKKDDEDVPPAASDGGPKAA